MLKTVCFGHTQVQLKPAGGAVDHNINWTGPTVGILIWISVHIEVQCVG